MFDQLFYFQFVNIFLFPATELVDEPVTPDSGPMPDFCENETVAPLKHEEQLHSEGLLPELENLTCRMTPSELRCCSVEQLVQIHDRLGGMMRCVVVELQTRLSQTDGKP